MDIDCLVPEVGVGDGRGGTEGGRVQQDREVATTTRRRFAEDATATYDRDS